MVSNGLQNKVLLNNIGLYLDAIWTFNTIFSRNTVIQSIKQQFTVIFLIIQIIFKSHQNDCTVFCLKISNKTYYTLCNIKSQFIILAATRFILRTRITVHLQKSPQKDLKFHVNFQSVKAICSVVNDLTQLLIMFTLSVAKNPDEPNKISS